MHLEKKSLEPKWFEPKWLKTKDLLAPVHVVSFEQTWLEALVLLLLFKTR